MNKAIVFIRSLIFNILFYPTLLAFLIFTSIFGWVIPNKLLCSMWNDCFLPFLLKMLDIVCGLKFEIRGEEYIAKNGAVYASKHESAVETYFLSSIIKNDSTFIFKKELTYIPFFGWAVAAYGSIPVDRSGGGTALRKMLDVVKTFIKKKRSIIIFPEGTRTKIGKTTEYKPGVAFIYQNTDAPVIPVALNTGFFWQKRSFLRYPGKIIIEFMPPIEKKLDKRAFIERLKNTIEAKCTELNAETIKNYPYIEETIKK